MNDSARFRKVLVRDLADEDWKERLFIADLGERAKYRYICLEDGLIEESAMSEQWRYMKEIEVPKRVPYTQDTFPLWAVWIRGNTIWDTDDIYSITSIRSDSITASEVGEVYFSGIYGFEIAGVDGVWKPFFNTDA